MGAQAVRLSNIDIDNALENRDFEVMFQPIFDLGNGALARMETFVRWRHPKLGVLPPGAFISFFETQGRMGELTRYVLEEALDHYIKWRGNCAPGFSINLATTDLADSDFPAFVTALLRDRDFPADAVTFECPMPSLTSDIKEIMDQLASLKTTGVRLAIEVRGRANDFLRDASPFPFEEIKTGGAAILRFARTVRGPGLSAISELLDIANNAGASITAVGVEDQASLAALRGLGFSAAQGNHLGKVGGLGDFRPAQVNSVRELLELEALTATELSDLFRTERPQITEQSAEGTTDDLGNEETAAAPKPTRKRKTRKTAAKKTVTKPTEQTKEQAQDNTQTVADNAAQQTDAASAPSVEETGAVDLLHDDETTTNVVERARRKAALQARKKGKDALRVELAARRKKLGLSEPIASLEQPVSAARNLQDKLTDAFPSEPDRTAVEDDAPEASSDALLSVDEQVVEAKTPLEVETPAEGGTPVEAIGKAPVETKTLTTEETLDDADAALSSPFPENETISKGDVDQATLTEPSSRDIDTDTDDKQNDGQAGTDDSITSDHGHETVDPIDPPSKIEGEPQGETPVQPDPQGEAKKTLTLVTIDDLEDKPSANPEAGPLDASKIVGKIQDQNVADKPDTASESQAATIRDNQIHAPSIERISDDDNNLVFVPANKAPLNKVVEPAKEPTTEPATEQKAVPTEDKTGTEESALVAENEALSATTSIGTVIARSSGKNIESYFLDTIHVHTQIEDTLAQPDSEIETLTGTADLSDDDNLVLVSMDDKPQTRSPAPSTNEAQADEIVDDGEDVPESPLFASSPSTTNDISMAKPSLDASLESSLDLGADHLGDLDVAEDEDSFSNDVEHVYDDAGLLNPENQEAALLDESLIIADTIRRRTRVKKNFLMRKYPLWPDHFWPRSWRRAWDRRAANRDFVRRAKAAAARLGSIDDEDDIEVS